MDLRFSAWAREWRGAWRLKRRKCGAEIAGAAKWVAARLAGKGETGGAGFFFTGWEVFACQLLRAWAHVRAMLQPLDWDALNLVWDTLGATWDQGAVEPQNTHTMASDNRISLTLTPTKKAAILAAVAALKAELVGVTINLTVDERQTLPKIGDKTLAFDEKCKTYMSQRPELVPGFVDMAEMVKDRALVADLAPILSELLPICEGVEDTMSLAYTDIYLSDLSFYQSVKQAAKRGAAGTDTIYNDLKERFPGRPPATPPAPTPPTP